MPRLAQTWWHATKQATPKLFRKGLATIALLTPWMIWKQSNECVFDDAQTSITDAIARIKDKLALWAKGSAQGLLECAADMGHQLISLFFSCYFTF
jgi:hypothetical protein